MRTAEERNREWGSKQQGLDTKVNEKCRKTEIQEHVGMCSESTKYNVKGNLK